MFKKVKIVIAAFAFFVFTQNEAIAQLSVDKNNFPLPKSQQLAWHHAEFGVVFHYDLHVFDTSKYNQKNNRITPIADYNIFNPSKLNVEQWVLSAKNAGAKFALITATHETGCLISIIRKPLLHESAEVERWQGRYRKRLCGCVQKIQY